MFVYVHFMLNFPFYYA